MKRMWMLVAGTLVASLGLAWGSAPELASAQSSPSCGLAAHGWVSSPHTDAQRDKVKFHARISATESGVVIDGMTAAWPIYGKPGETRYPEPIYGRFVLEHVDSFSCVPTGERGGTVEFTGSGRCGNGEVARGTFRFTDTGEGEQGDVAGISISGETEACTLEAGGPLGGGQTKIWPIYG